ncbi:MAG: hypothetical protein ABH858_05515, partial [Candidatus Omnitrophota bacterium]
MTQLNSTQQTAGDILPDFDCFEAEYSNAPVSPSALLPGDGLPRVLPRKVLKPKIRVRKQNFLLPHENYMVMRATREMK